MIRNLISVFLFISLALYADGKESQISDSLSEMPQISLITCGPGKNIYELEGHTALRVRYKGSDIAVNYGLFDFAAPNFVYRFVKGETDYMVGAAPYEYFLTQYRRDGRDVWEQPLNLSAESAFRLVSLLDENLQPENRVYRYNYVKDNCATTAIDND